VQTHSADLLQPNDVAGLPDADNVIYLVGMKFGTTQSPSRTWAINCLAPAAAAQRYPHSCIVALSTGNVYPLVSVDSPGAVESDPLRPVGEYANSCLARERLFDYFSQQQGTPLAVIRLNYALDLRYGVLHDLTSKIWHGQPVDVTMGYVNCIWQGDANDMIIRALALTQSPPQPINLTGLEALSVRALARQLGELLGKPVELVGSEAPTALLSNAHLAAAHLQAPPTPLATVLRWTAHWVQQGGPVLGKPTHFQTRDGDF
jgi:nucleoside-diphosphate-sugar epimerase